MAKSEPREYRAMISDEGGIVRGRIPSPLVRDMGARAGDYMVFRSDGTGKVTMSVLRSRKSGGSAKGRTVKSARRR
ncbi:MAG: hypothetical protein H7Y30_11720 [Pyrinomonadaceae bacterium]|nr:hypothetical protein [Pyrinomonadaceae bacterium]